MNIKMITTDEDLQSALAIRKAVFVEEQGVALADEFDQFDDLQTACEHILVIHEEKPVGVGRLRMVEGVGKLERVCILQPYRQLGIGKEIIATLENMARKNGATKAKLHGQSHAKSFYEKLGYHAASEEFMEDGIPHYLMMKNF